MKRGIFQGARRGGKGWATGLAAGDKPKKAKSAPKPRPDPKPIDDIADLPAGAAVLGRR